MSSSELLRKHGPGYAVAIVAVVIATIIRLLIDPLVGDRMIFFTFFFAVILSAWYGSFGPGLLAVGLSILAANYFFMEPRFGWGLSKTSDQFDLLRFVLVGVSTAVLCGQLRWRAEMLLKQQQECKLAEERVQQHRDLLQVTLAGIGDAVISTDAAGQITFINPVAEKLTGWRSAEALGLPLEKVFAIINEQSRQAVETPVAHVLREGKIIGLANHTVLIAKDRTELVIEDSAAPIKDRQGKIVGVVLVFRDATEKRNSERQLQKQAERQRLLGEAAAVLLTTDEPDAMMRGLFAKLAPHFELDTYFNFMVNDAGDALRLESCIGIPEATVRTIQRLEFGQAICGTVAQLRQAICVDHIQQSSDPKAQLVKSFGIQVYACNPLLSDNELLGTLSFASRRRQEFEPDEIEFLRTISHYVTAAYERLRLIAALRAADRRKDEFLAVLAHELRNPLAPIRNSLQVMQLAAGDPDVVDQARALMARQVGQMVRLIDDLLDVSRITRGKLELRKERVPLQTIVNTAVETCQPLIAQLQHRLSVSLPVKQVMLDGDPTRLAQVIANLLHNAAKFTPAGGEISLSGTAEGSEAVIRIKDNGQGIPAEALPRLFEMFMQADGSLEKQHGGLGIGLNLALRLVEMHGGSITARSEGRGRGSEFVVRLPVAVAAPSPTAAKTDRESNGAKARLRVLVADDNHDAADTLAAMLRIMGHEVRTAYDGQQAVDAASAYQPDVAVLDIGMPRLNGYDAARSIRARQKEVLLLALTGWGQDEDKRRSHEAGFDHHLTKPADLSTLGKILAERKPLV